MNARSLISPDFSAISSPHLGFPSRRALFNLAQVSMVLGYVVLTLCPFDGDAMLLGLLCQAAALWLYVMSRHASKAPSSA